MREDPLPTADIRNADGAVVGSFELDEAIFGVHPNVPLMHQVVTAQLAARRAGTQSTKTRAEVRGGGAKPWRQKGTGRARQGSIRAPHWRGGGVALGPKPRSYAQKTPKKMIRAALHSALSDRAVDGRIVVLDAWGIDEPKTKSAKALLAALQLEGKVLVVVEPGDTTVSLSFRNLPDAHVLPADQLNAYDVLCNDWILIQRDDVPTIVGLPPSDSVADGTPVVLTAADGATGDGAETGGAETDSEESPA